HAAVRSAGIGADGFAFTAAGEPPQPGSPGSLSSGLWIRLRLNEGPDKWSFDMSMFDALKNLGGIGGMGGILAKAREMQEKMKKVQEELGKRTVSADAAGGMVTATVNGKMELLKVRIDKTKIDVNDTALLEDLICAAVHAAQVKAGEMI